MKARFNLLAICVPLCLSGFPAQAFEGRITAVLTRGGEAQSFTYTVGTNMLRIERNETDRPYARNLIALDTGAITLLFPHNRSFVRLQAADEAAAPDRIRGIPRPPGGLPRGIGPQPGTGGPPGLPARPTPPAHIGPTNLPGMPEPAQVPQMPQMPQMPAMPASTGAGNPGGMPAMPMMPMPGERLELKATDDTTNLLGYACARYELKQRGESMTIWATDKLLPFRAWLPNQLSRFGPRLIEERWGELLQTKRLFPLLATLKYENGPERLRFQVKSITPQRIEDTDGALFRPPADYQEIEPLSF